jgi:hypothetical protein
VLNNPGAPPEEKGERARQLAPIAEGGEEVKPSLERTRSTPRPSKSPELEAAEETLSII